MNRVMSYLLHSLNKFGFSSLEEVTASSLKRAFKRNCITHHPDHGGSSDHFDEMLSSYLYLSETLYRMNGGRNSLSSMNAPDELKQQRAEQERQNRVINDLFDDLVIESEDNSVPLPDDFHEKFLAEHIDHDKLGYADWLASDATIRFADHTEDANGNIIYGDIIGSNTVEISDFHATFECVVTDGKPPPTQHIILHPDEMGYKTNSGGYSLIRTNNFTSDSGLRPEYTDVREAFVESNTVYDKIAPPTAAALQARTYDELVKEREEVYTCSSDSDAAAIAEYEKKRIDEQTEHKKRLDAYFKNTVCLQDEPVKQTTVVTNEIICAKDGFIKEF